MTTQTVTLGNSSIGAARARGIALWALQLGVAGMFFMAGGHKLAGDPQMVGMFDAIGFGQWFRYLTGFLEVSGGLALLVPSLSGVGALLLTGVMSGAVATHLFILGGSPAMALTLLGASVVIAYGRRDRIRELARRILAD